MELNDILLILEKFEESDLMELKVRLKGDEFVASRSKSAEKLSGFSRDLDSSEKDSAEASKVPAQKGNFGQEVLRSSSIANEPKPTEDLKEAKMEGMKSVTSPIVGTFFARPSAKDEPFVRLNGKVRKGEVLCILEAMKIMNEIKSPVDGTIRKIFLEDLDMADFGKPLFIIEEE